MPAGVQRAALRLPRPGADGNVTIAAWRRFTGRGINHLLAWLTLRLGDVGSDVRATAPGRSVSSPGAFHCAVSRASCRKCHPPALPAAPPGAVSSMGHATPLRRVQDIPLPALRLQPRAAVPARVRIFSDPLPLAPLALHVLLRDVRRVPVAARRPARARARMRYRTVCNAAELKRLMSLQCRVNDRPTEGVPAAKLMFVLDGGRASCLRVSVPAWGSPPLPPTRPTRSS